MLRADLHFRFALDVEQIRVLGLPTEGFEQGRRYVLDMSFTAPTIDELQAEVEEVVRRLYPSAVWVEGNTMWWEKGKVVRYLLLPEPEASMWVGEVSIREVENAVCS